MKEPSRKYTDLIYKASSKFGNWDPPKRIQVGDYGTVNHITGQFEKDGNIYEDAETAHLTANNPPQLASPQNAWIVASKSVKQHELRLGPDIVDSNVAGLAQASIKGQWEFGAERGALLIMDRPRITSVPPKVLLKHLVDIRALRDKTLVTEVVSCPAYSLYLSSGEKHKVSVALISQAPVVVAPGLSGGGEITSAWWTQNIAGLFQDACDKKGSHSFTPLYALSAIRKKGFFKRDSPVPDPEDDDLWVNAEVPWDDLDEDGEEEEFVDTVS